MKRFHLFEFTDQPWYPQVFRRMQTDYLQFVVTRGDGHAQLVPLLVNALQHAGTHEIVDLCSGGTGPWERLQAQLARAGWHVRVKLTDQFPNPQALEKWAEVERAEIEYATDPVDALYVPPHLQGMRTLFEGFHHFKPEQARQILRDAQEKRVAIGIFEASLKPPLDWLMLLLAPLSTLLGYAVMTPFIRPRKLWRFVWTYLLPLVPLATCWDGVVSMLRVYSLEELEALLTPLQRPDYVWEMGKASTGTPVFDYIYLIGYPR
jgi:hypothetical protein